TIGVKQDTRAGSPLVPAGVDPDRDLRCPVEKTAEELLDLRARSERGPCLRRLPLVDAQEIARVLGVEIDVMRDVTRLLRHVACGGRHLIVDLPNRSHIVPL